MDFKETPLGILFSDKQASEWLQWLALVFLLFLIPIVKSGIESVREYNGKTRIAAVFFYMGFAGLFLLFASLCYPVSQYRKDYQIAVNYKDTNQEVVVTSGKNGQAYKNNLSDFKTLEFGKFSNTSNKGSRSYNYDLNIVRKDGLRISLGNYSEKEWIALTPELRNINLPIEESAMSALYSQTTPHEKINHDSIDLKNKITSGNIVVQNGQTILTWDLKANPLFFKLGLGLLGVAWMFTIFQTLAANFNRGSFIFMYVVVILLSVGFGYYFLNTFRAKQYLLLTDNGYESYTQSHFLGKTQTNIGNWADAKIILIDIGPNQTSGIIISETENITNDFSTILKQSFQSALDGKYKYIRSESLSIYDQLLLADYVLEKKL